MFAGTVGYYRQHRPEIPAEVADILDGAVAPAKPRRLLDVGTGTGLVAEALLDRFDDIIAIDNDATMLEAADQALRPQLPAGSQLTLVQSTAEHFTPPPGWRAHLVTICRAFHWLDQTAVLDRLVDQVEPGGAVAIFADSSFWTAANPWQRAVRAVIQEFLGEQRRAGQKTFNHIDRPYIDILAESAFKHVQEFQVPVQRTWSSESVLGYLYSTSFASPDLFGEQLSSFEKAVKTVLAEHSAEDTFIEDNEFVIHIGRKEKP